MENNKRLFLDIHAIQTLPPSNMNRDDTGSPKTAQYGGVRRSRVSSQSWKKAMREYFNNHGENGNVGVRTLEIVRYIADKIIELDNSKSDDEAVSMADDVLKKSKISTKDHRAKALFFLGDVQAKGLAKAAIEKENRKDVLQNILRNNPAIDIALFGRMVADDPSLNEDASSQVAHAVSTHAVQNEFDFYTAVDDLSKEDNAGAGMLGTIEFNSSTLYRYANIAVHELNRQLKDRDAVIHAIQLFIEAFSKSLPTGKSNTFANQTLPQVLVITLRDDRPVNLVSAFENPIRSSEGYVKKSIEKLSNEFKKVEKFVESPLLTMYISLKDEKCLNEIGEEKNSLKELLNELFLKLEDLIENSQGD